MQTLLLNHNSVFSLQIKFPMEQSIKTHDCTHADTSDFPTTPESHWQQWPPHHHISHEWSCHTPVTSSLLTNDTDTPMTSPLLTNDIDTPMTSPRLTSDTDTSMTSPLLVTVPHTNDFPTAYEWHWHTNDFPVSCDSATQQWQLHICLCTSDCHTHEYLMH